MGGLHSRPFFGLVAFALQAEGRSPGLLDPAWGVNPAHGADTSLGHLLSQMGRHIEAEPFMRRARQRGPLFAMSHALSSRVADQARDYASAVEYGRQAITIEPDLWIGHIMLGQPEQYQR